MQTRVLDAKDRVRVSEKSAELKQPEVFAKALLSLRVVLLVTMSLLTWLVVGMPAAVAAADITAPTTNIALSGTAGTAPWYKSAVKVTVSAVDNKGGVGVAEIRCVLDPASPPASFNAMAVGCAYTGAGASVGQDGTHIVYAASADKAGNVSAVKLVSFKLDATPPVVTLSAAGTEGDNGWYVSNVTVRTSGSDDASGITTCTKDQSAIRDTSAAGVVFQGTCKNGAGLSATTKLTVKVDKTPPVVTVVASPASLWPPKHQLVDVSAVVGVTDNGSGPGAFVLSSVTSSEADEGIADGDVAADIQGFDAGTADAAGQLRAERSGGGDGRFYTLTYQATDQAGNAASANTAVVVGHSAAGGRRSAISQGADRVVMLQRADEGWEGTWRWYIGDRSNPTNLTGEIALSLIEAYNDTKEATYLESAKSAAAFSMAHLGGASTGTNYFYRMTAPDILLLYRLASITGDDSYSIRAGQEWQNIKKYWPTAAALDSLFRISGRRLGAWDLANYLEAAKLAGDDQWANDAADILANSGDAFYYDTNNPWYTLTAAGALRVLAGYGYADTHLAGMTALLEMVMGTIADDNIAESVQATAYGVLALKAVGGAATGDANAMARWLAGQQTAQGGWVEGGYEYPEADGEAVQAMAATVGTNASLLATRGSGGALWRGAVNPGRAEVFDRDKP